MPDPIRGSVPGIGEPLTPHYPELPDELPEGYYLDNFRYLLEFVTSRYEDLLVTHERDFAEAFFSLDDNQQKLFVRLANRKGPVFRVDKLNYPELGELPPIIDTLKQGAFLTHPERPLDETLPLLNKGELLELSCVSGLPKSAAKGDLLNHVLDSTAINPFEELSVDLVEPLHLDTLVVMKLLFFGNFHQDMTEFVLHELVAPFETYELTMQSHLFESRQMVEAAIELKLLSELAYDAVSSEDCSRESLSAVLELLPPRSDTAFLARRHDRIVNRVARQLERLSEAELARQAYELAEASPARERRARLLAGGGDAEAALALCEEISVNPLDEEEFEFAVKFGQRISKKHDLTGANLPAPPDAEIRQETISLDVDRDENNAVELDVRDWFEAQGKICYYVENTLIRSLFGLCFWDIIFAPVRGAFFNPFQRGPADLFDPEFTQHREGLIRARFELFDDPLALHKHIRHIYEAKFGLNNQFVSWAIITPELLTDAMRCIPPAHLRLMFERMLTDLRNTTNGMPDLVVFDHDSYELVEVKGPGDRLQKNQTRWFNFFAEREIPASVVNVVYL